MHKNNVKSVTGRIEKNEEKKVVCDRVSLVLRRVPQVNQRLPLRRLDHGTAGRESLLQEGVKLNFDRSAVRQQADAGKNQRGKDSPTLQAMKRRVRP